MISHSGEGKNPALKMNPSGRVCIFSGEEGKKESHVLLPLRVKGRGEKKARGIDDS